MRVPTSLRLSTIVPLLALAPLLGCSTAASDPALLAGERAQPIVKGEPDTKHPAVVAVLSVNDPKNPTSGETCSGTIVKVDGNKGYVLTAAHCFTDPPATATWFVVAQPDYAAAFSDASKRLTITDKLVHPHYDPTSDQHLNDVAMLTFEGAAGMPTVALLTPDLDDLAIGNPVQLVGYGFTSGNPGPNETLNTARLITSTKISLLSAAQILIDQSIGGQCQGDSGGPLLAVRNGTEYVAGVIAFGDSACTTTGGSVRLSSVYTSFVQPYLEGKPPPTEQTCSDCQADAFKTGGSCKPAFDSCSKSASCASLSQCEAACNDDACVDACEAKYASGVAPLQAVEDCLCKQACVEACASDCGSGGQGGASGSGGQGGASGAGGSSGSGGQGGSGQSGSAGVGGASGQGGASSEGGTSSEGGASGQAGSGEAGAPGQGGAAGQTGTAGKGGSQSGGSAGAKAGSAGQPQAGAAGQTAAAPADAESDSGCALASGRAGGPGWLAALLACAALGSRRRRRTPHPPAPSPASGEGEEKAKT